MLFMKNQIVFITIIATLFINILFYPTNALAAESINVPKQLGGQITSEVRNEATSQIFNALENFSCNDDPNSFGCEQTKRQISISEIGLGILGLIGFVFFIMWILNKCGILSLFQ